MNLDDFDFEGAVREAFDYAAVRCPRCGTGNTRCAEHADNPFLDNMLEHLGATMRSQVYETVRVNRDLAQDVAEDIEDMILRVIPKGASSVSADEIRSLAKRAAKHLDEA